MTPPDARQIAEQMENVALWLTKHELPGEQADQCGPIAVSQLLIKAAATIKSLSQATAPIRDVLAKHDDGEELEDHDGNLAEAVQCMATEIVTLRAMLKDRNQATATAEAELQHWRSAALDHGHIDAHSWSLSTDELKLEAARLTDIMQRADEYQVAELTEARRQVWEEAVNITATTCAIYEWDAAATELTSIFRQRAQTEETR